MTHSVKAIDTSTDKAKKPNGRKAKSGRMAPATNGEILVKGVVMGFIISGISHASRSISSTLIRHPLTLFSTGLLTGYLTHKYRKEIIMVGSRTCEESKNFVLRQKENLGDLIAEIKEESAESSK